MEKETINEVQTTGTLRKLIIKSPEFRELLKEFEQWLRVFGFASSTVYYSPSYLRSFFYYLEHLKIFQFSEVTNNHMIGYMRYLKRRGNFKNGGNLSDNYLLNHLNAIKLFSRFVFESKRIVFDSHYRYSRGDIKERYWLSRREVNLLYNSCEQGRTGDFDRAMLSIYYGIGLRRMEGVGLDLSDIQNSSGLIYVRNAKFGRERFVPIGNRAQYDLENYSKRYRKHILKKAGNLKEKALLISGKGKRISGNAVYYNLQRLAEKAGIKTPISLKSVSAESIKYKQLLEFIDFCMLLMKNRCNPASSVNRLLVSVSHYYDYLRLKDSGTGNPVRNIRVKNHNKNLVHDLLNESELNDLYDQLEANNPRQIRNKVMLGLLIFQGATTSDLHRV